MKTYREKSTAIIIVLLALLTGCITLQAQTWTTVGSAGFSTGQVTYTSIALGPDGTPYVVYIDYANSYKATVMKDSSNVWVPVGSPGFSVGAVANPTIAIDRSGTPYVAYYDGFGPFKGTVMKYSTSTGWAAVGGAHFSDTTINCASIAIGQNDTPYVVCSDVTYGDKATVRKYDGTNWIVIGGGGCSAGDVINTTIAIDGSGIPYVAYSDVVNGEKATVMKYIGGGWVSVGSPGFSVAGVGLTSVALGANDTPYVAYCDTYYGNYTTVMKYNGSSWVTVGSPGFSLGPAGGYANWITVDACGTPYVAYMDGGHSSYATVMKYNGSNWISAGSPWLSAGQTRYTSIAMGQDGTPYVAYEDYANSYKATVMKLSLAPVTGSAASLCPGNTISLSDTSGSGAWSSGNTGIAIVATTGIVTGVAGGVDTIKYTVGCQYIAMAITVNPAPTPISGVTTICTDTAMSLSDATAGGAWSSSNVGVATIGSATGIITGVAVGTAIITYTAGDGCYVTMTDTVKICTTRVTSPYLSKGETVLLYPNPATTYLSVATPAKIENIVITNCMGETIYAHNYDAKQVDVDVSLIPPGLYFIRINGIAVKKFVKE